MRFEGEFPVPRSAADVLGAFEDVERMVQCMPGAAIEGRDADGSYIGTMLVAFGPKKINFKGKVRSSVDKAAHRGTLDVRGAADMRVVAPAEVHVEYVVRAIADARAPASTVSIVSEAELGGVLADFARTGGVAVTKALMDTFAQRLAAELSRQSEPAQSSAQDCEAPHSTVGAAAATRQPTQALSAHLILWVLIKRKFTALGKALRTRTQRTKEHRR